MIMAPASLRRAIKSALFLSWQNEINHRFTELESWHSYTDHEGEQVTFTSMFLSMSVFVDVAKVGEHTGTFSNDHLFLTQLREWLDSFSWCSFVQVEDKGFQLLIASCDLTPGEVELLMYEDSFGNEDLDDLGGLDEDDEEEDDDEEDDDDAGSLISKALAAGADAESHAMFVPLVEGDKGINEVDFEEEELESEELESEELESEELESEAPPAVKTTSLEKDFLLEIYEGLRTNFLSEYDNTVPKDQRQLTVIVDAQINGTAQTLTLQIVAIPTTLLAPDRSPITVIEVREASGLVEHRRFLNAKQAIGFIETLNA